MKLYECKGVLTLAQVDHLSGELLGSAWDQLRAKGARNIQLISALTKKGRPGQLLLIDAPANKLPELEEYLVTDLGISGWHRIATEHVHTGTEIVCKNIVLKTSAGNLKITARGKRIREGKVFIRPEHDDCVRIREQLRRDHNYEIALRELKRVITEALNQPETNIENNLPPRREPQSDEEPVEITP